MSRWRDWRSGWVRRARQLVPVSRPPAKVFGEIFRRRRWGGPSASGPGSALESTQALRRELPGLLARHQVVRLLDWPCGDLFWMSQVDLGSGVDYIGADVVAELIAENRQRHPRLRFECLDLLVDRPPEVDLILCRDALVHLTFRQIEQALNNLRRSPAEYLLTTTFPSLRVNRDVATGGWRPLNLELPPFSLAPPIERLDEELKGSDGTRFDKQLALWRLDQLAD